MQDPSSRLLHKARDRWIRSLLRAARCDSGVRQVRRGALEAHPVPEGDMVKASPDQSLDVGAEKRRGGYVQLGHTWLLKTRFRSLWRGAEEAPAGGLKGTF